MLLDQRPLKVNLLTEGTTPTDSDFSIAVLGSIYYPYSKLIFM